MVLIALRQLKKDVNNEIRTMIPSVSKKMRGLNVRQINLDALLRMMHPISVTMETERNRREMMKRELTACVLHNPFFEQPSAFKIP